MSKNLREDFINYEKLSPIKQALLDRMKQRLNISSNDTYNSSDYVSNEAISLAYSQRPLWFLNELNPNITAYNIVRAWIIRGDIVYSALEESINAMVCRHTALRTIFAKGDNGPVQLINKSPKTTILIRDLSDNDMGGSLDNAMQSVVEEANRPFDLYSGPLFRPLLLRINQREHILAFVLHHIIVDGWSLDILQRDLTSYYAMHVEGRPAAQPEATAQYTDFALWQQKHIQSQQGLAALEYWQRTLAGAPPTSELPLMVARPGIQQFRGNHLSFALPGQLRDQTHALAVDAKVSSFMLLIAAFLALFHRYTNQLDIVIGTPMANRLDSKYDTCVGFLANTVLIRSDASGNPSFRRFLSRVKDVVLGAYAHQIMPFERLVEVLQPERDRSRNALFQVMFAYQNAATPLTLPCLDVEAIDIQRAHAKFDLTFELTETDQGLVGKIEYNTDLFEPAAMLRLIEHYQILLQEIVADPDKAIGDVCYLSDAERQRFAAVPASERAMEANQPDVLLSVERQVQRTPGHTAVVCGPRYLTYQELFRKAECISAQIKRPELANQARIGIYAERSTELVCGLLGVAKAGYAYVPLDPSYPPERIDFMIRDAGLTGLLVQSHLMSHLPNTDIPCFVLEEIGLPEQSGSSVDLQSQPTADDLMYVIYTSGSTGKPKGAGVFRTGFANLLKWYTDALGLSEKDNVLIFTSPSFDLTQKNFFAPLMVGAAIHCIPDGLYDPIFLAHYIAEHSITVINCTPSAFYPIIDSLSGETYHLTDSLRSVCLGGEPVVVGKLWDWLEACDFRTEIFNSYGPTECSDVVAFYRPDSMSTFRTRSMPIGRPIPNLDLYLLDQRLQPVAQGMIGEIYIGGYGLGSGYLGRSDLTAAAFVPHPFSGIGGQRLYKSGDLGRHTADGAIEFLGRRDAQVKIRGIRIDLSEIEVTISQHPAVRAAAVLIRSDERIQSQIIAYLVLNDQCDLKPDEIRRYLQRQLPDYMLPSQIMFLETLPLTPSGKVDRKALPAPETNAQAEQRLLTPVQEVVRNIWGDLLGESMLGLDDNFFQVGGHSLMAAQVIARLRSAFNVHVPLKDLLAAPTIGRLANQVEQLLRSSESKPGFNSDMEQDLGEISGSAAPVSYQQLRRLEHERRFPRRPRFHIGELWNLKGKLNLEALEQSLNTIMQRHEVLRTGFGSVEGQFIQQINPHQPITITLIDVSDSDGESRESTVRSFALKEAWKPFELGFEQLLRATVLRIAPDDHVLMIWIEHIAADGWSRTVLLRELSALYDAAEKGEETPLPPLPMQYKDYALLQGKNLRRNEASLLAYWRSKLQGELRIDLPVDHIRPATKSFNGASLQSTLNPTLVTDLESLSRREGATLFITLLAGFKTLLSKLSGNDDIAIITAASIRSPLETEQLIGNFINMLILRTDLAGNPGCLEILKRVRDTTLGAYIHQDLPLIRIKKEINPLDGILGRIFFNFNSFPTDSLSLHGIKATPVKIDYGMSTFDLGVSILHNSDGIKISVVFNTDLWVAQTIEQWITSFERILTAFTQDSTCCLQALEL